VNQDQKLALLKANLNSTAKVAFVEKCNEKNTCNVGGRDIPYAEALESSSFCLILKLGEILANPALVSISYFDSNSMKGWQNCTFFRWKHFIMVASP
jgi:hypothetical protein